MPDLLCIIYLTKCIKNVQDSCYVQERFFLYNLFKILQEVYMPKSGKIDHDKILFRSFWVQSGMILTL